MKLTSHVTTKGSTLEEMEIILILIATLYISAVLCVKLEVSAPLTSVEEGGVFSVHCKVSESDNTHEVSIFRQTGGRPKRLSLNGGLVFDIEERYFLANRQMDDGGTVYFLSVMDTVKEDSATYICKVSEAGGAVLAEDSVDIAVEYFPEDPSPTCTPLTSPLTVPCGQSLTLNCTSPRGNPSVSMKWYRQTGSEIELPYKPIQSGDTVYTELTFQPRSMDEDKALFICEITSDAFPERLERCHVGPISVILSDDFPCNMPLMTSIPHTTPTEISVHSKSPEDLATDCLNKCSYRTTPGSYWILATIIAAILAIIFFIIVLSLVIKLRTEKPKTQYLSPHGQSDLYAEVENRRLDNRIYMALEKRDGIRCFDSGHDYVGTNNRRL